MFQKQKEKHVFPLCFATKNYTRSENKTKYSIYLLRSFIETCFARSSAGNACDCCSGVKYGII